jgi:hypothetical protein
MSSHLCGSAHSAVDEFMVDVSPRKTVGCVRTDQFIVNAFGNAEILVAAAVDKINNKRLVFVLKIFDA